MKSPKDRGPDWEEGTPPPSMPIGGITPVAVANLVPDAIGIGVKVPDEDTRGPQTVEPMVVRASLRENATCLERIRCGDGTNTKYGLCWFVWKFIAQWHRALGFVSGTTWLVVYLGPWDIFSWQVQAWHRSAQASAPPRLVSLRAIDTPLSVFLFPFLALLLWNFFYKCLYLKLRISDCMWPAIIPDFVHGVIIWTCISFAIMKEQRYEFQPNYGLIGVWIVSILISFWDHGIIAIMDKAPISSYERVGKLLHEKAAEHPAIVISGEAYHYVTRTRRVKTKNGYSTQTHQEKVVTATAHENMNFADVRCFGPKFNVGAFKQRKWSAFHCLFSARFFTVVADADTRAAIAAAVGSMRARMQGSDTHASAWSSIADGGSMDYYVTPGDSENKTFSKYLKVLCGLSILSGTQFIFFTLLGFIAHNPVLRYVKEISVHRFTEKEDLITNDGGMIIEQSTQKKWWELPSRN